MTPPNGSRLHCHRRYKISCWTDDMLITNRLRRESADYRQKALAEIEPHLRRRLARHALLLAELAEARARKLAANARRHRSTRPQDGLR